MLKYIYSEIKKINIRLSNLENKNNDKVDVESLINTNNILLNSEINNIKNRIENIEKKIEDIKKLETSLKNISN
jgi:tetrahydromethanopterin S-methyltransferase subunit G